MLQDRAGFIWLGTRQGLNRFDGDAVVTYLPDPGNPESLPASGIQALCEDREGNLWIGTALGGLAVLDRRRGTFRSYQHDPSDPRSLSSNNVTSILEDRSGQLWIGTDQGLNVLDEDRAAFRRAKGLRAGLPEERVNVIRKGLIGYLWVGTEGGLFHLDTKKLQLRRQDSANLGLPDERVRAIVEQNDGTLWVGTPSGLVRREGRTGNSRAFQYHPREDSSLSDNVICDLVEDSSGGVWIATPAGLDRYEESRGHFVRILAGPLDPASGSTGSVLCLLADRGGLLWAGLDGGGASRLRIRGVMTEVPGEQTGAAAGRGEARASPPPVAVTVMERLHQGGARSVDFLVPSDVELTARDTAFSLTIAVLDFAEPEKNRIAFKLEGLDADWTFRRGQGRAFYGQLPPGRYRFLMKGTRADGSWTVDPAVLMIAVKPPFFRTWWFYGFLAVCLVLPVRWLLRKRAERQREREDDLQRIIDEKTLQLENANRWLEKLSYLDPLTGVPNRRYFDEVIDEEWRRAQRADGPISLMFIDLDHFKSYNDMYGHQAGDTCLKSAAGALRGVLKRAGDHMARYGGEEFVVILGGASLDDALHVAQMMRESVESLEIQHEGNPPAGVVTASFGVASAFPEPHSDVALLIKEADEALYLAKENGRNRVEAARKNHTQEPGLTDQTAS